MRIHSAFLLGLAGAALVAACAGTSTKDGSGDTDPDDSDTTYVPDTGETGADGGDSDGFVVTFDQDRYMVDALEVLAHGGVDLTGDGYVDNKVGGLLDAIGTLGSLGISLDQVNENIANLLDSEGAIVLMAVEHDQGRAVHMDLVTGQRVVPDGLQGVPDAYDDKGVPKQRLVGAFDAAEHFTTQDGAIELPLQFYVDEPALLVSATHVRSDVTLKPAGIEGYLAGAFSVERVMTDIVEPLVRDYYYDNPNQADNLLDSIRPIVASQADIDVDTEDPKLSGAFSFKAHQEDWSDPAP
jgi:hypothetical protein